MQLLCVNSPLEIRDWRKYGVQKRKQRKIWDIRHTPPSPWHWPFFLCLILSWLTPQIVNISIFFLLWTHPLIDDTGIGGDEDEVFGKQLEVGTWIPCHQVGTVWGGRVANIFFYLFIYFFLQLSYFYLLFISGNCQRWAGGKHLGHSHFEHYYLGLELMNNL